MIKRLMFLMVMLSVIAMTHPAVGQKDFETALIHKLSQMTKTKPPSKIIIEKLDEGGMINLYKKSMFELCVAETGNALICGINVSSVRTFVFGIWVEEDDPTVLHFYVYNRAGIDTYVHEYLHWWLFYSTQPKGILGGEEVIENFSAKIMSSDEFTSWIKTFEAGEKK